MAVSRDSRTVQFSIDESPPTISGLSISNQTYKLEDIPLSFDVDENTSWVAYNLDNQGNVTIQGNVTLRELSDGSHSIVVYAKDSLGNMGNSETVFFTIDTPKNTTPETSTSAITTTETPTIAEFTPAILLSVMILIVFGTGLLVYFKNRKR
jgi:uncharacterized membrane protein